MDTSGGQAIGSALTSGIQDISALLPLLGTEQCEDHISSALTHGYLYSAATPLSIFGSLGAARAGFKALLSAISIPRLGFDGAKILADAGFQPQGVNLSLIMLEQDRKSYCAEKRLTSMMTDLHLDDSNRISVSSKCWGWNITMVLVTAASCIISITPYIHLNLHANNLTHFVRWAFPVIRAIGGFLTATMVQFVIQNRVLSIMRKRLILDSLSKRDLENLGIDEKDKDSAWVRFPAVDRRCSLLEQLVRHNLNPSTHGHEAPTSSSPNEKTRDNVHLESGTLDAEAGRKRLEDLRTRIIAANGSALLTVTSLLLLFIGIIASVVGYVGCFTAVQASRSSTEPLIWLGLEAGLSLIRIILWGLNPEGDDAPPLELTIKLDKHAPLPTCTRPSEEIERDKILPLVRAPEFLKSITSYAGLLIQFNYPSISLYYTLTRRNHATLGTRRVLYITIFDHTERTTRVYSEDHDDRFSDDEIGEASANTTNTQQPTNSKMTELSTANPETTNFYSADELTVDIEHGVLATKIGKQILHQHDPVASNAELRTALVAHYHSILRQVNSGIGKSRPDHDTVENEWTLTVGEKKSQMQKLGEEHNLAPTFGEGEGKTDGNSEDRGIRRDEKAAENGSHDGNNIKRDQAYLKQRELEQNVRHLIHLRGRYIEDYMDWLHETVDHDSRMLKLRGFEVGNFEKAEVEKMLIDERRVMELMLVDEIRKWEEKLRVSHRQVIVQLSSDNGMDPESDMDAMLERRWRTDWWEGLRTGELAMKARMNEARINVVNRGKLNEQQLHDVWEVDTSGLIDSAWLSLFPDFCKSLEATPLPSQCPSSRLDQALKKLSEYSYYMGDESRWLERRRKMVIRLWREVEDVEERLERGLERCREFTSNIELTHSHFPWLTIYSFDADTLKALKNNKLEHAIHLSIKVDAGISDADIVRFFDNFNSSSCTSIYFWVDIRIPDSVFEKLSPNLLSITGPEPDFGPQNAAVEQNRLRLEHSRKTTVEFANLYCMDATQGAFCPLFAGPASFTLRFFGPISSYHLTVQVIHHCLAEDAYLTVEGSVFKCPIPHSDEFVLDNITIWNNRKLKQCSGLSFEPGHRNTLTFVASSNGYTLLDVQLLDQLGNRYDGAEAA